MSALRDKIVKIAREDAAPPPFGKVSDMVLDENGNRAGWQRLKQYFDEAVEGWGPHKWLERGSIKFGGQDIRLTNLEGVQKPRLRVIQGESKPSGASWCGIFATWVWRQAGLERAIWGIGTGIKNNGVIRVSSNTGIQLGDIIVIRGAEVHHAIVVELPSVYDLDEGGTLDTSMTTVNGNSTNQSIRIHNEYKLSDVWYYYTFNE